MDLKRNGSTISILIIGSEGSGKKTLARNIIRSNNNSNSSNRSSELELEFKIFTSELSNELKKEKEKEELKIKLIKEINFIIILINSINLKDFNQSQLFLSEILPLNCFDKLALVLTKVDLNSKRVGDIAVFSRLSIPIFLSSSLNGELIGNRIKNLIINSTLGKQKPFQGLRTEHTFRFDESTTNLTES